MNNFGRRSFSHSRSFGSRNKRRSGTYINPDKYINKVVEVSEERPETITHRFTDFSLNERIVSQVLRRGYSTPTVIQDQAIPLIMGGHDVIGIADTGSGKTAAFSLPLIHKALRDRQQKVLIVVPTRELAVQINDEFRLFTQGLPLSSALCIGGSSFNVQVQSLRRNPQFIIGTPGRLMDHVNQRTLNLSLVNNLVLDEADRMVDMGFINDVRKIISRISPARQSLFFSATISPEVRGLINDFCTNPQTVSVKKRETSEHVEQDIIRYVDNFHRMKLLHELLLQEEFRKVLIFGRTKHGVKKLSEELNDRGFETVSIHGNKNQNQRQQALTDFKTNKAQILVATDIAARGLDIPDVTHVINFDVPENYADYVHRIGRTGRANKRGKALTFIS